MKTFEEVVSGLSDGQKSAIIRKVARGLTGDESQVETILQGVLSGELKIVVQDTTVKLVDRNGRCIPLPGMTEEIVDADRGYHLAQPTVDYAAVHARFTRHMPGQTFVTADQFRERGLAVIERVKSDRQIANLLQGTYLPVCFPHCEVVDYGAVLEDMFLAAVGLAYAEAFPERTFENWRRGTLAGQVTVVSGTRHECLIEAMRQGPTVGVYFPTCLQGFGILADRTMVQQFPNDVLLTGAFEPAMGFIGYSEVLGRDGMTPALDCPANLWQGPGHSLYFNPHDAELGFDSRNLDAHEFCSGGVVVLWQS